MNPTNLPYQFYKSTVNGETVYDALPPGPNYGGQTPITQQEYVSGVQSGTRLKLAQQTGNWQGPLGITEDTWNKISSGQTPGSGYITSPTTGNPQLLSQYEADKPEARAAMEKTAQANLAAIKNGTAPTNAPVVAGSAGNINQPQQPQQTQTTQTPGTSTTNIQTPMGTATTITAQPKQGNMTTPSLVDYLASMGMANNLSTRANLALQHGLVGSAQEYMNLAKSGANGAINTKLLSQLRSESAAPSQPSLSAPSTPNIMQTPAGADTGNYAQNDAFNQAGITPDTINQAATKSPLNAATDYLTQALTALGIGGSNDALTKANQAVTDLALKKQDEINNVNNNPWLSESVRQRTIERLNKDYATKEDILTRQQQLAQSQDTRIRDQAQWVAGQAMTLSHQEAVMDQNMMLKAMDIAQREAEAQAALNKPTNQPASVQEYEYAKSQGYKGSFSQYQNDDANRKISVAKAGVSGLSPTAINSTVNSIAGAFDGEQIVKDYNAASAQYQLMENLGVSGNNSGDDIAFVYAFAKMMDPNSVVREGEYATIQKYAQSFLDAKTLEAIRLVKNKNFLTPEAKQQILTTAKAKMKVLGGQYNNLQSEYQRQIDGAYSGQPRQLTNYATPSAGGSPGGSQYTNILDSIVSGGSKTPVGGKSSTPSVIDDLLAQWK
jgi:hypothetical protein